MMTKHQTKMLLLIIALLVLVGALAWTLTHPNKAVAPVTPEVTADDTPKQVRMDTYICDNGKEFQLQYDEHNNLSYTDSSMTGSSEPLWIINDGTGNKYENDTMQITLQDSNAVLEYKTMDVNTICELKDFEANGITREEEGDQAAEATMFGDVLVDGTTTKVSLPKGTGITVQLVSRDEEGQMTILAETTYASNELPSQFTMNASDIKMTATSGDILLMAEVRDADGNVLYKTEGDVSVMQESDALAIPVVKQ